MISEVGYLHENPEIEALLLRKGIQPIPESEFLTAIDIALTSTSSLPENTYINDNYGYDDGASAHILTGLEPIELQKIRKKGFEGSYPGLSDPRSAVLSRSLRSTSQGSKGGVETRGHNDLPPEVASALDAGVPLEDAVRVHVMRRFGNLVLIAFERVDAHRPLDAYGMDSMVGAEFRSWFYKAFGVDVPFLEILGKATTLDGLSRKIVSEIEKRR